MSTQPANSNLQFKSTDSELVSEHASFKRSDFEQCKLRIALCAFCLVWSNSHALTFPTTDGSMEPHLLVAAIYLTISLALLLLWKIVHSAMSPHAPALRYFCLAADISAISTYSAVADSAATILLPIYLSAIIGYGMRFGRRHLVAALTLSIFEFLFVANENQYLSANRTVVVTYLLSISFVPLYTIILLKKYATILEAYVTASSEREEFIRIMSHEFRAPLHSIVSLAELCQSRLRASTNMTASINLLTIPVKDILRCSERMLAVANRIAEQQTKSAGSGARDCSSFNTYRDVFLATRICDVYAK